MKNSKNWKKKKITDCYRYFVTSVIKSFKQLSLFLTTKVTHACGDVQQPTVTITFWLKWKNCGNKPVFLPFQFEFVCPTLLGGDSNCELGRPGQGRKCIALQGLGARHHSLSLGLSFERWMRSDFVEAIESQISVAFEQSCAGNSSWCLELFFKVYQKENKSIAFML